MAAQGTTHTDYGTETDEDLLIFMSMREEDVESARAAWAVFHARHARFIYGQCCWTLERYIGDRYGKQAIRDMAAELANETLLRVCEKAGTFKLKGSRDPDQMRRQVRAWAGTIARNIVCDWLRNRSHETGAGTIDALTDTDDEETNDEVHRDPVFDCIRRLVDALPEKERMVLDTYMMFYDPRDPGRKLPSEESKQLAAQLGLSTVSLRQIKGRVMKRLEPLIKSDCLGGASL